MRSLTFVILPMAMLSMLLGILGGWVRIGWHIEGMQLASVNHGILMLGSFLGTLVALERVITLNKWWAWLAPFLMGFSLPLHLIGQPKAALWSLAMGALLYLLVTFLHLSRSVVRGQVLLSIGAFFQFLAIAVFLSLHSYTMAVAAWFLAFLFTIVGERLELTRFLPTSKKALFELSFWLLATVLGTAIYHSHSSIWAGIAFFGVAQWLLRYDIALINIEKSGSYRFLGYALVGGFLWLAVFGLLSIIRPGTAFLYDAVVHSFFIGFILSMILAHAPIIFPSILGLRGKPFHPVLYVWLILLHLSLLMRISGDLWAVAELRKWGGLFNGLSFLLYLITVIFLMVQSHLKEKK